MGVGILSKRIERIAEGVANGSEEADVVSRRIRESAEKAVLCARGVYRFGSGMVRNLDKSWGAKSEDVKKAKKRLKFLKVVVSNAKSVISENDPDYMRVPSYAKGVLFALDSVWDELKEDGDGIGNSEGIAKLYCSADEWEMLEGVFEDMDLAIRNFYHWYRDVKRNCGKIPGVVE